jgi:hypothetical protein
LILLFMPSKRFQPQLHFRERTPKVDGARLPVADRSRTRVGAACGSLGGVSRSRATQLACGRRTPPGAGISIAQCPRNSAHDGTTAAGGKAGWFAGRAGAGTWFDCAAAGQPDPARYLRGGRLFSCSRCAKFSFGHAGRKWGLFEQRFRPKGMLGTGRLARRTDREVRIWTENHS